MEYNWTGLNVKLLAASALLFCIGVILYRVKKVGVVPARSRKSCIVQAVRQVVFTDVLIVGRLDVDGQSFAPIGQGCEWNDRSLIRERESRPRIGSDATFFWDSCSNLEIDDNFRISHNLGLSLAANISTALAIQPDRYREIEII